LIKVALRIASAKKIEERRDQGRFGPRSSPTFDHCAH
jgi:hypothetical protein